MRTQDWGDVVCKSVGITSLTCTQVVEILAEAQDRYIGVVCEALEKVLDQIQNRTLNTA